MTNKELNEAIAIARGESGWEYIETITDYDNPAIKEKRLFPEPKPYATDMNAAMELLCELPHDGPLDIRSYGDGWYSLKYWQYDEAEEAGAGYSFESRTFSRAICKAWLEWKGVEI